MGYCAASQNYSLALPAVNRSRFSKLFLQFIKGLACRFGTWDRSIAAIRGWKATISRRICWQGLLMGIHYHNHTIHNTRTGTGSGYSKRLKQDMANAKAGFLRRRELGGMPNGQNSVQTNVDARLSDSRTVCGKAERKRALVWTVGSSG